MYFSLVTNRCLQFVKVKTWCASSLEDDRFSSAYKINSFRDFDYRVLRNYYGSVLVSMNDITMLHLHAVDSNRAIDINQVDMGMGWVDHTTENLKIWCTICDISI